MNKTLEEIGQAIFKHWFVDLEFPNEEGKPYKSSGGEMVYNEELGKEIPKGWKVKEIGEFIEFVKGRKPDVVFDSYEEGLLPQILIDVLDGGNPNFSNPKDMIISDEADIIIVMDGASSGRTERGFAGILGSTLAKIKVKELNQDYAYYLLKGKEEDIKVNTTGTSIPHADKKKIEKYLIPVPSKKILEDFQNKVNKLLFRQILIRKEIKILSQIRDSLLPKVMAGKIRVPLEDEK
jgi:type I restriction enzyme S subunit